MPLDAPVATAVFHGPQKNGPMDTPIYPRSHRLLAFTSLLRRKKLLAYGFYKKH